MVGEPDNAPSDPTPGWAAPEAPAVDDLDGGPPTRPAPIDPPSPAAPVLPGGRPLVPARLHPLTVADVLDGAWTVITCRPRPVFGATALVLVPVALLGSWLVRAFGTSLDVWTQLHVFYPYVRPDGRPVQGWPGALAAVAVLSLGTFVLGVAIARLAMGWYDGQELTAIGAVRAALRSTPAILGAYLVLAIPKAVAIAAFLIPAWLVFPFFLLVAPVIAVEGAGPLRAIRRSAGLVGRRYLRVLMIWTLWLAAERVIALALTAVIEIVAALSPEGVADVLRPAGWALAAFVIGPAVAGLSFVLYLDMRVRCEGLDLERDVAEAFGGA